MTPEQRLNRITSILSVGVIRLVNEKIRQENVKAQVEMLTSYDQVRSSHCSAEQCVTPEVAPGVAECSTV